MVLEKHLQDTRHTMLRFWNRSIVRCFCVVWGTRGQLTIQSSGPNSIGAAWVHGDLVQEATCHTYQKQR